MAHAELDIRPRLNGRAPAPMEAAVLRELGAADLALLATERGTKAPTRKRLRDRHHSLARCLAQGMKPWEASAVTGYSPSTVSILQADPSFNELVEFYRSHEDALLAEFTQRAGIVTLTALDNIAAAVEDEKMPLSVEQNLQIVKALADRTGHAPVQRSVNANVNVDLTGRLSAAKRRLTELAARSLPAPDRGAEPIIDVEFEVAGGHSGDSGPGA